MPFSNEAFGPDVIEAMSAAYEKACTTLQLGAHSKLAREVLASHIIDLAQQGCTDADKLYAEVLKLFGLERIHRDGESPPLSPNTAH